MLTLVLCFQSFLTMLIALALHFTADWLYSSAGSITPPKKSSHGNITNRVYGAFFPKVSKKIKIF